MRLVTCQVLFTPGTCALGFSIRLLFGSKMAKNRLELNTFLTNLIEIDTVFHWDYFTGHVTKGPNNGALGYCGMHIEQQGSFDKPTL